MKSVWYCKHIGIAFVTSSSHLMFRFSGMDERTERRLCYGAMAALLVVQNYLTTGFLAQVYIATLRPTDIGHGPDGGSPALTHRLAHHPIGLSTFSQTIPHTYTHIQSFSRNTLIKQQLRRQNYFIVRNVTETTLNHSFHETPTSF